MRIGVISDIHGNIKALETVLQKLEEEKAKKIICLGDLIGGAANSEEVIQKIINNPDKFIVVRGNREKYIIEGMPQYVHDEKKKISEEQILRNEWIKKQLSSNSIEFIKKLPKEIYYEIEGKKLYIAHYPMKENWEYRRHIKKATPEENEEMFNGIEADIYLYGHVHNTTYNKYKNKIYINPGATGCPQKTNLAPYGILDINEKHIEYTQKYATYEVKQVIDEIKQIAFPGYKSVLKLFY